MALLERRTFLSTACMAGFFLSAGQLRARPIARPPAASESYRQFLEGVRSQALADGLSATAVTEALAMAPAPNQAVLARDRHQPEFTMTWAQYRSRVLKPARLQQGAQVFQNVRATLTPLAQRYGAADGVVMGIWGLESGFGATLGKFNVIDALATLAYDGRRAKFFRSELLKALRIVSDGEAAPSTMLGSYAGAMGQPQFMPSAYLQYAVDVDGDGKPNIWTSKPDVFASIANYLGRRHWIQGQGWGTEVSVPQGSEAEALGAKASRQSAVRSVSSWEALGVRPVDGAPFTQPDLQARLLEPDGPGGQAFLVFHNFNVIRAYNPSDYYALAVGLLGDACTGVPA
nr:lytic murein transglycosylase [Oecophyllibacter saccharovorans]